MSVTPTQLSSNRPLTSSGENSHYTDTVLSVDASYEADVWGRVRRTVEASRSEAQATAADLATVSLSLHAELALDYFQLRGLDAQEQILNFTVDAYGKALQLTQSRYHGGIASALDVAQAQTQLETTRAQAQDVGCSAPSTNMPSRCLSASRRLSSAFPIRRSSRLRPSSRLDFRPICWNAGRTSPRRNGACRKPTPMSASPAPLIFR